MTGFIKNFIKQVTRSISSDEATIYVGLIALAGASIAYVELERSWSVQSAQEQYVEANHRATLEVASSVRLKFRQIYQGMRTIARLPGVRSIDRYARDFDGDARKSAQEIYNNLAENVAVSELYIVPLDFAPDALDPNTGKLQEPITTFDELIVGKTADTPPGRSDASGSQSVSRVEEIEIFEYRLMKRQIAILKRDYALESAVRHLAYPAIVGEEVITCDNTRYSPLNPDDNDRKGLVYSVPFYGPNGRLRGIVSAVILTAVLRDLLPDGAYAIQNLSYLYGAGSSVDGVWQNYGAQITAGRAAHDLIYSEVVPLEIDDVNGGWKLWAGRNDDAFFKGISASASNDKAALRSLIIAISCLGMCFVARLLVLQQRSLKRRNVELEAHVLERTLALNEAKDEAVEANRCKTAFLANVSHEIRTPMSAIFGMTDLLAQNGLDEAQTRQIEVIHNSSQALLSLVNQILDLSAVETGKVCLIAEPCSVSRLFDEVIELFTSQAEAKGLELSQRISADVPDHISVDGGRLRQILVNLVSNSIKYTDTGEVTVSVRLDSAADDGAIVLWFEVSDSGCGIDPEAGNRIFEAFQRGNTNFVGGHGGIGLGLSICRHLVELMGGRIECESVPNKGTTFFFTVDALALGDQSMSDQELNEAAFNSFKLPQNVFEDTQILLVEDNATMRELTIEVFDKLGCQTSVAHNGKEAVATHSRKSFDMIFMDCRMPEMDGYHATKIIRERERKDGSGPVPIIAMTANAFEYNEQACLDAGMTDFLSKPVSVRQIFEAVERNLHRS